jgi:hypothetical protein
MFVGHLDNRQQLKILVFGRAPSCFKYYLKAYGGQTIIFGVSELKKSSGSYRQVAWRRPGDVFFFYFFLIGRLFFIQKHRPI